MAWSAVVLLGGAASLGMAILATLVARAARGPQLRLLALWLAGHALFMGAFAASAGLSAEAALATRVNALLRAVFVALPFLLLAFLGTIEVPLARPLRDRPVRVLLLGIAATLLAIAILLPESLVRPGVPAHTRASWPAGVIRASLLANVVGALHGLLVGVQAARRSARGTLERSRAVALLAGVILVESLRGGHETFMLVLDAIDPAVHVAYMETWIGTVLRTEALPVLTLAGTAVLAYGMLRLQLFDVDLRVKWTIRRGTLIGAFIGVFLVISEVAQGFLSDAFGWALGGLAAALLGIAIQPLQRLAERVAESAMPGVRDTPEWRDGRKADLYRTAIRLARADGIVTRDEELHLADLATQLGLDARRALDLRYAVEGETRPT